jgi:peroxiredoxin (alkyl hydroperoxide reductase subunit C)
VIEVTSVFPLPAVFGVEISLGRYFGKKNVVISFVPAAWTPVCSDQCPDSLFIDKKLTFTDMFNIG